MISRSGQRFVNLSLKEANKIPGPGSYQPKWDINKYGNYADSKWRSSGATKFSHAQRKVNLDTSATRRSKLLGI